MDITKEKVDDLNAIIKVAVKQADYQEKVDKVLKDHRKNATMGHTVISEWQGGMSFNTKTMGGNVTLDADNTVGGEDKGVRPKALMLVALSGCTGMDVASLLKKMRVDVDSFKIEVSGELTEEHPKYYHKVKVDYYFSGSNIDHTKVEKAVNLSVDRYCGVFEMFRKFSDISHEIHYS